MNLTLMQPNMIFIAVVVALIIAAAVVVYIKKRKDTSAGLRDRFGTEYERAVQQHGSERKAEAKLSDREARVEKFKIRDLTRRSVNLTSLSGRRCNPVLLIIQRVQ